MSIDRKNSATKKPSSYPRSGMVSIKPLSNTMLSAESGRKTCLQYSQRIKSLSNKITNGNTRLPGVLQYPQRIKSLSNIAALARWPLPVAILAVSSADQIPQQPIHPDRRTEILAILAVSSADQIPQQPTGVWLLLHATSSHSYCPSTLSGSNPSAT